jgi:hypothetical protein
MARLYSNENLAIDLVEALRQFNHNILSSYDAVAMLTGYIVAETAVTTKMRQGLML